MIRHILAVDNDEPVCASCVLALRGRLVEPTPAVARAVCANCGRYNLCTEVQAYTWPATGHRVMGQISSRTGGDVPGVSGGGGGHGARHGPAGARSVASCEEGAA